VRRRPGRQDRHRDHQRGRRERAALPEHTAVLTIDGFAAGGEGVGRIDGMAVFVPRTVPGDVAQIAYTRHARHGRGRVLQLLDRSVHRVEARCGHYEADRCGACQLQHVDAETQRHARQHMVQETLRRLGRRDVALPPITADLEWHYRGRLTLVLLRRSGGWVGGLHPHDDARRVFALEQCEIAHPLLVETWHALRPLLADRTMAMPDADSLRLGLRLDADAAVADLKVTVVLQGGARWADREPWSAEVLRRVPQVRAVWWEAEDGTRDAALEDGAAPEASEALAFAQVNARVADALREHVYAAIAQFSPQRVVDGYAGTGQLTERLAQAGREVIAVEADAMGARRAEERLLAAGEAVSARAHVVCDLMERALPRLVFGGQAPDVVVLNPPRRGVDARVTAWLEGESMRPTQGLVYVSCDPATLARDLSRMPSWDIVSVQCFDMFPQTAHVETVCVLQRSQGREAA
jgi:23S rRNA (uracil1939-C5)-methyltransferase